tara:strand:+ start:2663 stop:2806 length:144 start_codon:yes stop_codon:yes gene_type:complete
MPDTVGESTHNAAVADGWCWRAEAKGEAESGADGSTFNNADAERGRV